MNYKTQPLTSKKLALVEFARTVGATHLVTLNFHHHYDRLQAEKKVGNWHVTLSRRLFRTFQPLPAKRIDFVAFPEYSLAGHIHYHAAVRIPQPYQEKFLQIAPACWKRVVPTSTFDLRPIGPTEEDLENVLSYITKSSSAADVIHSSMFHP